MNKIGEPDVLDRAKAKRSELRTRLREVEKFIRDYEAYAGTSASTARKAAPPGQPREFAAKLEDILLQMGPLTINSIVSVLHERGVIIPSNGKERNYVNTILWRNQKLFIKQPDRTFVAAAPLQQEESGE